MLVVGDKEAARIALLRLIVVAAVTTGISAVLRHPGTFVGTVFASIFPCVIGLIGVIVLALGESVPSAIITAAPVVGLVIFAMMALVTHDSSAAVQVYFAMPILFSAAHLCEPLAYGVVALAIVSEAWIALSDETFHCAVRDIAFTGTAYMSICVLLVAANRGQRQAEAQLRRQADIDGLTGLVTRRVLDEAGRRAIIESAVGAAGTALIMMDVDRFKTINDTYGHLIGDDALNHIATIVRQNARPEAVIGRIGGDEIAVLLPGCRYETARGRAEQLVRAIRARPMDAPGGGRIPLAVSAGVAHVPTHGLDLRDLYSVADEALYEAKRNGRNQVGNQVSAGQ